MRKPWLWKGLYLSSIDRRCFFRDRMIAYKVNAKKRLDTNSPVTARWDLSTRAKKKKNLSTATTSLQLPYINMVLHSLSKDKEGSNDICQHKCKKKKSRQSIKWCSCILNTSFWFDLGFSHLSCRLFDKL